VTDGAARSRTPLAPRTIAAIAALVVLVGAIASITPDPIGVFWDDGVYLLTAKALAAGDGYRYAYLPGAPPAIHYPPGFPLLLAAVLKVTPGFPANVAVLKLLNPICLALGVYGAARLGARALRIGAGPAAVAVAICALIAPVMVLTNVLLSESLFFALLAWTLIAAEAAVTEGGTRRALAAGALCALLALVRTVGGVMIPAALVALWWRGRRREAALLLASAVVLLGPWQLWVWAAARGFPDELRGSYGPYLEWVVNGYRRDPGLALDVLVKNAGDLWRAFGIVFAPRLPHVVQEGAACALLVALGAGHAALARRAPVLLLFLLAYGVIVLLWPYNPERFVWAVWPLAGLVLVAAATDAGTWLEGRWPVAPRLVVIGVSLLLTGHAAYAARGLSAGWAGAPQRAMTSRLWPLVQWSVTHAGDKDIIASDGHVMIALYTGHTTMPVSVLTPAEHVREKPVAQFADELWALDARYRPTLLVLSPGTAETEAVPVFARRDGAPFIVTLPLLPGGGAAFALRRGRE
jgi:4-amino-4-deoxy-L-arabinose transferase-like glycosyltransferase